MVSADASSVGLGATISHKYPDGTIKVIQHASRALTKPERAYSQIDREGLAIIFAVKKFHKMLFGRHFSLQTDHKPLLRIFGSKKGIPSYTANRLQRFALTLLGYDFDMEYVRTDDFGNADLLSRLIQTHAKPEEDFVIACVTLEAEVKSIATSALDYVPLSFQDVVNETAADKLLREVCRYVQHGWPRNSVFSGDLAQFYSREDSLSVIDGCLLFGERVVIPHKLQSQCLRQVHLGHPDIQRRKALSRSYFYWPGMDRDITEWVNSCQPCQLAAKSPPSCTKNTNWPSTVPWHRVHVDYAGPVNGEWYLVVVDSFSKWPEIIQTSSITTKATIGILRALFARFGMPVTLISDNGTQFTSAEFDAFCRKHGIVHITTPPYHPQSNGQAERFVDTFKRTVKKIVAEGYTVQEALDLFLLTYRNTPNPKLDDAKCPAEVILGRRPRTTLELLLPPCGTTQSTPSQSTEHRKLRRGEQVYSKDCVRNGWKWTKGTVLDQQGTVMYLVRTIDGRTVRRPIDQLRRCTEACSRTSPETPQLDHCRSLPLDILLDAWGLQCAGDSTPTSSSPIAAPDLLDPVPTMEEQSRAEIRNQSPVEELRRSSRCSRPPPRFEAYRLS